MKTIVINASPRKKWNTAEIMQSAQKGAESVGAETEYINLYDIDFKGCRSCLACKLKSKEKTQHITMYDNMQNFLRRYNKIIQKNLWKKWYNLELAEKSKENSDEINVKKIIILDICKTLIYLEINKIIVKNITESINKIAFEEGTELFETISEEYTNLISKAHYKRRTKE